MKKSLLTLSLLSVLSLAGCGGGSTPAASSEASKEESSASVISSEDVSSITSEEGVLCTNLKVKAINDVMCVGDSFEITDFYTVTPAEAKVYYEILTDNVTIEGNTATVTAVGDFKIRIHAGANDKIKNLTGTVISAANKAIREFVSEAGYDYITSLNTAENDSEVIRVVHDEDYFLYYDVNNEDPDIQANGLLTLTPDNGNIYQFELNKSGAVNILPGIMNGAGLWHNYYGAFEMPISATQIEDEVDEEGNLTGNIVINATTPDDYDMNNLSTIAYVFGLMDTFDGTENGTDDIRNPNNVYNMSKLVLQYNEEKEELRAYSYDKDGEATGFYYTLTNIEGADTDPHHNACVAAAKTGEVPPEALITEIKDFFATAKAADNFSIKAVGKWKTVSGGEFTEEESDIVDQLEAVCSSYNLEAVANTSVYSVTDLNVTDTSDETKHAKYVYQKVNDVYYKLSSEVSKGAEVVTVKDTYTAAVEKSLQDAEDLTSSGNFSFCKLTDTLMDAARYSSKSVVAAKDEEEGYTEFRINMENDSGAFAFVLTELFPTVNPIAIVNDDGYGSISDDWYKYNYTYVSVYDDSLKVESYTNIDVGFTKARYSIEFEIYDVGDTVVTPVEESLIKI
ncbi:MAG: hypothetical protein K5694_05810 [Bacilli bacterium]|nr:hypothetical protein [Bacilli bacterium]